MRSQLSAACVVVLAVLAGCSSADSDRTATAAFTLTDSAGVMRAINGLTEAVPVELGSGLQEEFRIGAAEGPEHLQFHRVWDVKVDSVTGEVLVINGGSHSVRVFARDGTLLREFGSEGRGPGEFETPRMLWLVGDSVFVYDIEKNEMAIFLRSGIFVSAWPLRARTGALTSPMGWTPEGWLALIYQGGSSEAAAGREYKQVQSVQFVPGLGSNAARAAGEVQNVVTLILTMVGIGTASGVTPEFPLFAPIPSATSDNHGRTYVHYGAPYVIDVHDTHGRLVRRVSRQHEPVPLTEELIAEYERRAKAPRDRAATPGSEPGPGEKEQQAIRLARVSLPRPDHLPPLGAIHVAEDGALWVHRLDLVSDPIASEASLGHAPRGGIWDRFDAEGRFLGSVKLPETFSPRSVTANSVAGVFRDELGVEYVVRYVVQNK